MRLLLHACCGPCATHCIGVLRSLGHSVTLFFSNANIAPSEEYEKRLEAIKILSTHLEVPLVVDEPDHADWLQRVAAGFEGEKEKGARCTRCFRYSLERTHLFMALNGFEGFTTTLSVSPHKNTPTLFEVGRSIDRNRFLAINFKQDDGFKHSLQLTKELGLYRQNYCGCEFSTRP
jgi:predicted adenine nucleotide alpha hydrolase (AANH) superfamily ATPase